MRHSPCCCPPTLRDRGGLAADQPTVLTIDDDPNVCQALARWFSRYRATVLQSRYGMHGIWRATNEMPDLIIADLKMPQGRGRDVVGYLVNNEQTRHIPVIVLTGIHDEDLKRRMLRLGVKDYLTKPVQFEQLRQSVARYVDLQEKSPHAGRSATMRSTV